MFSTFLILLSPCGHFNGFIFNTALVTFTPMRKMHFSMVVLFMAILFCSSGKAQTNPLDSNLNIRLFSIGGGQQIPVGLLAKRFGSNSQVSFEFHQLRASSWILGVQGGLMFGNQLREDTILKGLTTTTGDLISESGIFANYNLSERGSHAFLQVGKRIRTSWSPNPSSGFIGMAGFGFLQHKIRIEAPYSNIPSIQGEYKKGYDRLTFGPAGQVSFGYQYLGNNRRTNFYIGLDYQMGWTKNRRSINFDSGLRDPQLRFDQLLGLKVLWSLPLYKRSENDYYFFD